MEVATIFKRDQCEKNSNYTRAESQLPTDRDSWHNLKAKFYLLTQIGIYVNQLMNFNKFNCYWFLEYQVWTRFISILLANSYSLQVWDARTSRPSTVAFWVPSSSLFIYRPNINWIWICYVCALLHYQFMREGPCTNLHHLFVSFCIYWFEPFNSLAFFHWL